MTQRTSVVTVRTTIQRLKRRPAAERVPWSENHAPTRVFVPGQQRFTEVEDK